MVFDLKSQINSKFNITSDLLDWLWNKGKPLQHDFVPLQEISAGAEGCENDVSIRKFDSLIGKHDLKLSPKNLITDQDDVNNLRVCNKH